MRSGGIYKDVAEHRVVGEDHDKDQRAVEEVAVNVHERERQPAFAAEVFSTKARFTHSAVWRIAPEGLVIRTAVVVASETESAGDDEDQKRWRDRNEPDRLRQPRGPLAEPRVVQRSRAGTAGIAPQYRRVRRRQVLRLAAVFVWAIEVIVLALPSG